MRQRSSTRKAPHVAFLAFFCCYFAAAVLWLGLGLTPAVAAAFPALRETFYQWGLASHTTNVWIFEPDSFDTAELVARAGAPKTIALHNQDSLRLHNLSVYADAAATSALYKGEMAGASSQKRYTITIPQPGTYFYQCDLHPEMRGTMRVYPATNDAPAWIKRLPVIADLARGIAAAAQGFVPAWQIAVQYLISALNLALAVLLVRLRSGERAARLLAVGLVGTAAVFNLQPHSNFLILAGMASTTQQVILIDALWHMPFHVISGIAYVFAMLVFPDGKFVPRLRYRRPLMWMLRLAYLAAGMYIGFTSGLLSDGEPQGLIIFFGVVIPIAGIFSQAVRYRQAISTAARQQSRVLLLALAVALSAALLVALFNLALAQLGPRLPGQPLVGLKDISFFVFPLLMAGIPITLFAVLLRYRLWDIDHVINRAMVYAGLTTVLGIVYLGSMVLLGWLVQLITGRITNDLTLVGATLAIATLFSPLRQRVQRFIDRRFYRRRYDAVQTLQTFSSRLRNEVDLGRLNEDLMAVIDDTMQPAHVSLWLRTPEGMPGDR